MHASEYKCKEVKNATELQQFLNDLIFLHETDLIRVDVTPIRNNLIVIALVRVTIEAEETKTKKVR